ncbi:hypothetical protein ACHWQZ_G000548 [Mnemiopsis leidyi]
MCDMYLGYKIGPAADLWALGVLLYKLCFFTTPFEENTLAIARAKYTIPETDKYSANLISIIRDTLKVNPSDRLTTKQILSRLKNDDFNSKGYVPAPSAIQTAPTPLQSAPSSNTRSQPLHTTHDPVPRQTESAPLSEDTAAIKPRSRPRAANKPNEALLIAPPDLTTSVSRDSGISSRDSVMTSRDSVMTSRDCVMTSRDCVMTSRDTNDIDTRVKRHSAHGSPQLSSLGDPWGNLSSPVNQQAKNNTVTPSSTTPLTPLSSTPLTPLSKTRTPLTPLSISPGAPLNPLAASSTLVYLPPPPASPSHKPARRRGHSRAKSDTTFLKNISNPMTNPFLREEEKRSYAMSSSTGQLSGMSAFSAAQGRLPRSATTSREEGVNNNRGCSSETNFEECGWSNNPFEPTPAVEDEFLKLSLRDKGNSQTRLDQIAASEPTNTKPAKSNKVARAKIPRAAQDPSSNEPPSSHRARAFSNEAAVPLNRTLSDPPPSSPSLQHGQSLSSLTSLDAKSPSTKKKRKPINLFGKKKVLSQEDFVAKHSGTYNKSVLGNPLYDDLNT